MFTADMLKEAVATRTVCNGLDEWIEEYLVDRFAKAGKNSVKVDSSHVYMNGWVDSEFISSMKLRGFNVVYECEDRPCGTCWYRIFY